MPPNRRAYNPSGRTEIARLKVELDRLILRVESSDPGDDRIGDLNRYLCVRVCGFLEMALVSLARSACEQGSWGTATRFALSFLERAPNPSARELLRMVRRFSDEWGAAFEEFLKDEDRFGRLNALVGIRNDIAHGKNQGVSARQAVSYYELAQEVIAWMADRLEPTVGR